MDAHHPLSDSLTLDRRSLVALLLSALAGLTVGGSAAAVAPLPVDTDCTAALQRLAEHPGVEYANVKRSPGATFTTIDFDAFGLAVFQYDGAPSAHSLMILNREDCDTILNPAAFVAILDLIGDHATR